MERVLYTAEATVTGGRQNGHGRTSDGQLDVQPRAPKEMGGEGGGTNPEELFAVGFAACFESALGAVARREHQETGDVSIESRVNLSPTEISQLRALRRARRVPPRYRGPRTGETARRRGARGVSLLERDARQYRRQADRERARRRVKDSRRDLNESA